MMKLWSLLAAFFFLTVISGCGGGGGPKGNAGDNNLISNTTTTPSTSYMPSAVGDTWTYRTVFSGDIGPGSVFGNQYQGITFEEVSYENTQKGDNTFSRNGTMLVSSQGTSTLSVVIVYDYVLTNNMWAISREQGTFYDAQGIVVSSGTVRYTPAIPDFPSRTAIGTHEQYRVSVTSDSSTYNRMQDLTVAGLEAVTVPAGTFANALKITNSYGDTTHPPSSTAWYVENVGLVKDIQVITNTIHDSSGTRTEQVIRTRELTSYTMH